MHQHAYILQSCHLVHSLQLKQIWINIHFLEGACEDLAKFIAKTTKYVAMHLHTHPQHMHVYTHRHAHAHTHTHLHTHARTHARTHAHIHVHILLKISFLTLYRTDSEGTKAARLFGVSAFQVHL